MITRRSVTLLLALALAGCADDDSGGAAPADGETYDATGSDGASGSSPACQRDPDLIAQGQECLRDDLCPCGTHCDLGRCVAACMDDGGCGAGERCDDFGRCGPEGQGKVGAFAPAGRDRVRAAPGVIRTGGKETPFRVRVHRAGAGGRARVVARGPVKVRCAPDAVFAAECLIADLPAGGVDIEVQRLPDAKADDPTVTSGAGALVFDDGGHMTFVALLDDAAPEAPLAGRYEGFVWLGAPSEVTGPAETNPQPGALDFVRGPATVRVFGASGAFTVEITDRDGVVLPAPLVLAGTRAENGALSATLPAVVLYGAATADGEAAEVSLASVPSTAGRLGGGLVELRFDAALLGLDLPGDGVPWRLVVSATRVEDLPEGATAPAPTDGAVLAEDLGRGAAPSAAFQLAQALADGGDPASVPGDLAPFAAVGAEANGVACFASPAERAEAEAARSATITAACNDSYAAAGFGVTTPGPNGRVPNAPCAGAATDAPVQIHCEWSRVDQVQVGTGCGQCVDACVAQEVANCQGDFFSGYCGQFDPQVNCNVCPNELFQPLKCDNPSDQDCYTACTSYCQGVKSGQTFQMEQVTAACDARCKAPPTSCTPAPVFEDETVQVGSCDALAAAWGCAISDASGTQGVFVGADIVSYEIERACNFDPLVTPTEAQCVTAAQCLEPDAFGANVGFGAGLSEMSGDPVCAGAVEPLFPALEGPIDDLEATLSACAADIGTGALGAASLDVLFGSAGCFDRGRFLLATDRAFASTRAGAPDPTAEAMGHRMVQGFVQLHALVATLGRNLYREQSVLGKVVDPSATAVDALEHSMALWPVVLHPRIAGALLALSPEVAREPDPRPRLGFDATDAVAVARVGVAVDLMEALTEQIALVDLLLDRAWFEGDAGRMAARRATASELLRLTAPVGALVAGLAASGADGDTTWGAAWKRTAPRYRQAVEALVKRLDIVASGANPIGIEDSDLPLYFQGDLYAPNERFSAISRGLLGQGVGSFDIVPQAVAAAQAALEDVAAKWQERASAKVASAQRIQDIKYRYGEMILVNCGGSFDNDTNYAGPGMAPCLNPGSQEVFDCADIDTEVCFVEESCRPRHDAFLEELTSADLAARLCVFSGLRQVYGANLVGATPAVDEVLKKVGPALAQARAAGEAFPLAITSLELRSATDRVAVVDVAGATVEVPLDALGGLDLKVPAFSLKPGGPKADVPYFAISATCEASRQASLALRPTAVPAACARADECPVGQACRAGHCEALSATDPLDSVDCYYDGDIAVQAIAVRAAAADIDIARREFDELLESYDIAKRSCIILKAGNDAIEAQTAKHNALMKDLDTARAVAAGIATAASAAKDCAASFNVESIVTGAVAGVCIASGVEAAATIAADVLETVMGNAERAHEEAVLALAGNTEEEICFNDAEMELVGARAALMRIERARQDQAAALVELRGLKSYTYDLFVEGGEAVAREEALLERSVPSQFLLSEAAERFDRRMAYARRVVYLTVRAVEYEFQTSLSDRQKVLSSTRPDQLEQVIQSLSTWVNSGKVKGASPDALHAVLSLREHLLQVGDKSGDPAGQKGLTDVERFRLLLTSRRYGEYDDQGNYLGQRIPFRVAPLAALGLGKSQGVPIVADNDCAERLWSVNAAVLGEGVYEGNQSSFTRLDLLKKNTFFSQWCEAPKSGPPFQVASVRPAINLLQDPTDPDREKVEAQDVNDYTRGRMQPYLNVSRADLEMEDYAQGATMELAGRGLYGDYAIFIPKAVLSLDGSPGLRLDRVDDILLRLDYVSVAR